MQYLLFLNTMLKIRLKMLKMMPLKPKTYMTVTAAMWKRERMVIVDPSGGIPSVSIIIIET